MVTLHFDETQLAANVERLPHQLRAAFASACAERLMPAYLAFSNRSRRGNGAALKGILTRLWDDLAGDRMKDSEVQSKIDACMALIPREDDGPWSTEQASAEDAGASVGYALRCRKSGRAQEAAWAARRAYEALDHYAINRGDIDTNKPGSGERVLGHPVVQAELARQRRDLDEAPGAGDMDARDVVTRLRERAVLEGAVLFGPAS
jgi:hypothetical protein